VAVLVELEVGELQPGRGLGGIAPGPAQDGPDPGDDLLQAERLGHVVVAAQGQAPDLVLHRVPRGQEDDGDAGAAAPQPPDDVEPVHVGQHDVEHDEIRPVAARRLHASVPPRR
jgi:hypothetical protein